MSKIITPAIVKIEKRKRKLEGKQTRRLFETKLKETVPI